MEAHEQIHLQISKEIDGLIESRHILKEDIRKTIYYAETSGEKFINPSTGRSLASLKPGRVTYWVEYTKHGETFEIHRAYSHRIEMKRGTGP